MSDAECANIFSQFLDRLYALFIVCFFVQLFNFDVIPFIYFLLFVSYVFRDCVQNNPCLLQYLEAFPLCFLLVVSCPILKYLINLELIL